MSPNFCDANKNYDENIKILLTNARSLSPKIQFLLTTCNEHDIDLAFVSESWLRDGNTLDRDVIDLEYGSGMQIIYKNRPKRSGAARRVGGGVSLIYNKARCSFRERKMTGNKFEPLGRTPAGTPQPGDVARSGGCTQGS